jgi:hypothetical protein
MSLQVHQSTKGTPVNEFIDKCNCKFNSWQVYNHISNREF